MKVEVIGKNPICCGVNMYNAGGLVGAKDEYEAIYFYRCEICGKEIEDIPYELIESKLLTNTK